jgi:hypothetical protein
MAFSEIELKLIENTVGKMCQRRSPVHLSDEVKTTYKVIDSAVEIYEERPGWRHRDRWSSSRIARFRYTRSTRKWKLYWMRQDLKWQLYEPFSESTAIEKLVTEVDTDPHAAFWG